MKSKKNRVTNQAMARVVGRDVPCGSVLVDIPKPEKWRTDLYVSFSNPPVGFAPLMSWRDVAGLTDDDLKRIANASDALDGFYTHFTLGSPLDRQSAQRVRPSVEG